MSKFMTLLVEDDTFQREVLADILKDEGFEVRMRDCRGCGADRRLDRNRVADHRPGNKGRACPRYRFAGKRV
jgi:hypothetical protein